MVYSERILKIEDGQHETKELAQCDDQSDWQWGTFGCQYIHGTDTDVPDYTVKDFTEALQLSSLHVNIIKTVNYY